MRQASHRKAHWTARVYGRIGQALLFVIASVRAVVDSIAAAARGRFTTVPPERCEDGEEAASPEL